jgi:hypothetical protein
MKKNPALAGAGTKGDTTKIAVHSLPAPAKSVKKCRPGRVRNALVHRRFGFARQAARSERAAFHQTANLNPDSPRIRPTLPRVAWLLRPDPWGWR